MHFLKLILRLAPNTGLDLYISRKCMLLSFNFHPNKSENGACPMSGIGYKWLYLLGFYKACYFMKNTRCYAHTEPNFGQAKQERPALFVIAERAR